MSARVLVVAHAPSPALEAVVQALVAGATDPALAEAGLAVQVVRRAALEATAADVRAADALLLATPVNFGYLSGALKHFFDTVYPELAGSTDGLPFGAAVKGTTDASGAVRALEAITTGLRWRAVRPVLSVEGPADEAFLAGCAELGAVVAAGCSG